MDSYRGEGRAIALHDSDSCPILQALHAAQADLVLPLFRHLLAARP